MYSAVARDQFKGPSLKGNNVMEPTFRDPSKVTRVEEPTFKGPSKGIYV